MANFLAIITLINNLFPLILQTIKLVEAAFPQGGQGAKKLDMVLQVVQQAASVSSEVQVTAQQLAPVLTPIVSSAVALFNATGQFNKSAA